MGVLCVGSGLVILPHVLRQVLPPSANGVIPVVIFVASVGDRSYGSGRKAYE